VKPFAPESSEAERTEQALRDSEERFRLATQAGKIGIWDWDVVADEISWSESLYGIHGVEPDQLRPTVAGFESLIHPDDRQMVAGAIRRALQDDAPYELEFRAVRPDGEVIWLFTSAKVIREGGKAKRMLGATLDVTERKRVEFALRESEERFAKAFNSSPLSLTISSLVTGKLVEVNETFVTVTGFSREEAIGRTTAELGVWARPGDREQELADVAGAGRLRNREYVFRVRDGQEITGILSAETIDIGGEPCALTVIQDITDRKKFEQALREADRRKDEFLATLAHELRNPLAPIRNGIEVLKHAPADPVAGRAVLEMMDRQLAQMVRLVDDLLDVSRISRGKIELRTEPVELSAAIRNALETNRQAIEAAGHELVVDVPAEKILVEADLTRLSQVLANLLDNAAKYTPHGGRITLSVEAGADEVGVRVRDNGIGIPEHMIGQVFDLFTQVDGSLEKSQSGLGIGLTIVKRLVEMHGGRVAAHSEGPGKGTEFIVRLPRLASAPAPDNLPHASSPRGPHRRILVVDDNRDAAESMAMMLEIIGHETSMAHDGHQALEVAEAFRPDTILLDIGMPGMNGYETCRRLRETPRGRDMVVVALTGWGQDEDRERSREAGFDHHLTKPVELATLQALLTRPR
jgi:PAS domain S-box-containing protein